MSKTTTTAIQPNKRLDTLRSMLELAMPKLQQVAGKYLKVERMIRLLLASASRNPKLLECTQDSVLNFAMKCAETGLEPIGAGGMWPVPYKNKYSGQLELTAIPDYRGLVHAAKRSECVKDAWAEVVYANDEFDCELGESPKIIRHVPSRGDRGELEAAYCVIERPDGSKRPVFMSRSEIEGIRKRSKASNDGPWVTDLGEMAKKTVVRRAMKPFAGLSTHLDAAIEADDAALGLDLPEERPPIPMPKALPPADPAPAAPTAEVGPAEDMPPLPEDFGPAHLALMMAHGDEEAAGDAMLVLNRWSDEAFGKPIAELGRVGLLVVRDAIMAGKITMMNKENQ